MRTILDNDLKHVLISLLNVDRPFTNKKADKLAAKERARSLYNSGDILAVLCEPLSRNQLKETLNAFLSLYRVNINQFIDEKSSSLSIQAKEAMKGFGKLSLDHDEQIALLLLSGAHELECKIF